jgi:molecular chaperone GrpE
MAAGNNDDNKSPKPNVGDDQDSAAASGAAGAADTADAEMARLKAENAELLDRLLRSAAETENTRKRGERTTDEARKYAISDFAREMLTVADNLDRAMEAAVEGNTDRKADPLLAGLEATQRILAKALEKFGIRKIQSGGATFDPELHEAVMEIKDTRLPDGQIAQVIEDGYTIQDKLLRPARVVVAGSGPLAQTAGDGGADRSL